MIETFVWRPRPMFVTSTFRDMHAERDHLREVVFPALDERLRARCYRLEPIDLRWGIETLSLADQEAKELLVLKVCLSEIRRSRPFLIALLGDRYGWVPPEGRARAAAGEMGLPAESAGQSVTALEIELGALGAAREASRPFFYFREGLPYDEMEPGTAALYSDLYSSDPHVRDGHARLLSLKARIERELPERVRRYRLSWDNARKRVVDLESWGQAVLEDLWLELDRETRDSAGDGRRRTWQAQERWTLDEFAERSTRDFEGRAVILDRLEALALSGTRVQTWGACVVGAPGSGKSTLLAALKERTKDHALVLSSSVGVSARSAQLEPLLRRWIEELSLLLGLPDRASGLTGRAELESEFAVLLREASERRRIVCLLDGIDRCERTVAATSLTWLPDPWPENARLIAAGTAGPQTEALEHRAGVESMPVPPLDADEAEAIIRRTCQRHGKVLHQDVVRVLLGTPSSDGVPASINPLWLTLAVQELLLLDADDFSRADEDLAVTPEARLHALLLARAQTLPAEVDALYEALLARNEKLHGLRIAQAFATLVAVSRTGLRESDLANLLPTVADAPWEPLRFAALRRSYRAHVAQSGPNLEWNFVHATMRAAVHRRYLAGARPGLHAIIGAHLETLPREDALRTAELMYHYIGARDALRAAAHCGAELTPAEEQAAVDALADFVVDERDERSGALSWIAALLEQPGVDFASRLRRCRRLGAMLQRVVEDRAETATLTRLLELTQHALDALGGAAPDDGEVLRARAVNARLLASRRAYLGDLAGTVGLLTVIRAAEHQFVAAHPADVEAWHSLATTEGAMAGWFQRSGHTGHALEAAGNSRSILTGPAASSTKEQRRDVAIISSRIGDLLSEAGDLAGALTEYGRCGAILRHLAVEYPDDDDVLDELSVVENKVAQVLVASGNSAEAIALQRKVVADRIRLSALDPRNRRRRASLSMAYNNLGTMLSQQGDSQGALDQHQRALDIRHQLVRSDPGNAEWQQLLAASHVNLADALWGMGDPAGALREHQAAISIRRALAKAQPENLMFQLALARSEYFMAPVLMLTGDAENAMESCCRAVERQRRLQARDPGNGGIAKQMAESYQVLALLVSRLESRLPPALGKRLAGVWSQAPPALRDSVDPAVFLGMVPSGGDAESADDRRPGREFDAATEAFVEMLRQQLRRQGRELDATGIAGAYYATARRDFDAATEASVETLRQQPVARRRPWWRFW